jgi:hypothetical protein
MQELFRAGGQGVSAEHLSIAVEPVLNVVNAMGIPTGLLCDHMERVLGHSSMEPRGIFPKACSDYDVLLCILSHRADRVASKYLKESCKMPKADGKRKGLFF